MKTSLKLTFAHSHCRGTTAILLLLLGVSGCRQSANPNTPPEKVKEHLSVRFPVPNVRPSMGPFFCADEKGWYADEGLDVTFEYGGESTNPVAMVLSGADEIGILGGPDTLLVAVGKGAPLVIVAIVHKDSNMPCLITKKESGLTTIEQLDKKRVGMFTGHISTDVLRNWFRKSGINVDEVDVGYDYSQFISGSVDAQWAFTTAAAVELPEKGVPVNVLSPTTAGIYTHGFTIFTTQEFIVKKPERIKGFLSATFKGICHTVEAPQDASAEIVKRDSTGSLNIEQVRRRVDQYNAFSPCFNPLAPGYFDRKMLEETYDRPKSILAEHAFLHCVGSDRQSLRMLRELSSGQRVGEFHDPDQ